MSTKEAKIDKFPIFQKRLKEIRGKMTQVDFAEKIGVSRPSVGAYENGKRIPEITVLAQIARVCNVSTDWLLGLTSDKKGNPRGMEVEKLLGIEKVAQTKLFRLKSCVDGKYKEFPDAQIYKYHLDLINAFIASPKFDKICGELYNYQNVQKVVTEIEATHNDIDLSAPLKDIPFAAFSTNVSKAKQEQYISDNAVHKKYLTSKKESRLHFFDAQQSFIEFMKEYVESHSDKD